MFLEIFQFTPLLINSTHTQSYNTVYFLFFQFLYHYTNLLTVLQGVFTYLSTAMFPIQMSLERVH